MKKIAIIGLGAIGSNLAMNLIADSKEHEYFLLDRDKVEPRNLQAHTQAFSNEQIDMAKAKALRINIYNSLGIEVSALEAEIAGTINDKLLRLSRFVVPNQQYSSKSFPDDFQLILDCLDNFTGRKILADYARKNRIECLHIGFSPQFTFEISWNENYEILEDAKGLDICQLSGASSFVKYVAALASSVVQDFLQNGKKRNLIGSRFSIREL